MVDISRIQGQFNGWQHLKTIVAAPAGTIGDETDWAGTNALPTSGLAHAPNKRPRSAEDGTKVQVMAVLLDDGVLVNRGTCTFTLAPIEVVRRQSMGIAEGTANPLPADTVADGVALSTDVVPNRPVDIPLRGVDQWTVRTSSWTNVPAGTTHAVLLWRPG